MSDKNFTELLSQLLPLSLIWLTLFVHLLCARYKVNYNKAKIVIIPTSQLRELKCNTLYRHKADIHLNQDLNPDSWVPRALLIPTLLRMLEAFVFHNRFLQNPGGII